MYHICSRALCLWVKRMVNIYVLASEPTTMVKNMIGIVLKTRPFTVGLLSSWFIQAPFHLNDMFPGDHALARCVHHDSRVIIKTIIIIIIIIILVIIIIMLVIIIICYNCYHCQSKASQTWFQRKSWLLQFFLWSKHKQWLLSVMITENNNNHCSCSVLNNNNN